ncbi:Gag-pol polyprotein, partial [Sesamum angolense]
LKRKISRPCSFRRGASGTNHPTCALFTLRRSNRRCGPSLGVVKKLLKEFEDVMPDELPRKLPTKRVVDQEIELVPDTKHPARAPYRMSQPKLMEFRKQLKYILESSIIKPVKSPYGGPVLFQKKADDTISFLGHIVERGRIQMDPKKVEAIEEWRPPSDVHDLRSFLDLANYYRHFAKGYSETAWLMTGLLKKTETWSWTPQCQVSFDNVKRAMVIDPVLALPDMSKTVRGRDRCFRLRIRKGPNARPLSSCL